MEVVIDSSALLCTLVASSYPIWCPLKSHDLLLIVKALVPSTNLMERRNANLMMTLNIDSAVRVGVVVVGA
jgi:hypothetical protein